VDKRSAPRAKKRMSCEMNVNGARHSGIALDISATGIFVQTNVKPSPGTIVTLRLSVPGLKEPVAMGARVARNKAVPHQLLTVAGGGVGFVITEPAEAYLDFVAEMSPEQAEAVARERAKRETHASETYEPGEKNAEAPRRFRIHAVETTSGRRSTYLAIGVNEEEASDQVLEQLGDEWKVLFIERA
jgi:hypothetical protein